MAKSTFTFNDTDKQRIKDAVANAEQRTSGEIVVFFVEQCDEYETVPVRGALVFIITTLIVIGLLSVTWLLPFHASAVQIAAIAITIGAMGYLSAKYIPALKRSLISYSQMQYRVKQRAFNAFLQEEVFNTVDRTGILIFVSHFEHMVEIVGDSGINAKVQQAEWEAVVEKIVLGIKQGDTVQGLIDGISLCGELLERGGVAKPPQNPNELPDDLRIE